MPQKRANIILVFVLSGMLIFVSPTDLRADTFFGSFIHTMGNYFEPALRTLNGSSRIETKAGADIRSAINRILLFSFGDSVGVGSSLSPEDAIRIRQQNDSIGDNAIPFSSDGISELNINAPSLFKEQTQFKKNIFLQGDLTADGSHIELGGGTLSASNVLYGLLAGDGISLTGNAQRPTISATQQFWQLNNGILSPRLADVTVSISGELQLQDILRFSNNASLFFDGSVVNYISDDQRGAWTIATSTEAMPLVSLDSTGRGNISFGATSSRAFVTVAGGEDQDRLFVGSADSSDFFIDRFGNVGINTDAPSETLTVSGTFSVTDRATFETSPRFASILNCVGSGALVTDSEGNIECGGFVFDTSPQFLSVTSCQGSGVLETDSEGRLVCGEDDVGRRSTPPGGSTSQIQFNLNSGFAGSAQFLWDNNTNRLSIATTSFETALNVGGSVFLSGGLGLGNATTTSGVLETSGLGYIGGVLKVAGSGTSTIANGLSVAGSGLASSRGLVVSGGNTLITSGNVGIGTTSPAQLLSVSGDSYLVGGLGVGNATTTDGIIETSGLAFVGGILKVKGTSTSTFDGGLSVGSGGLASSKGISLTGGVFNSSVTATSVFSGGLSVSHLTTSDAVTANGAGTSTFTGGISAGIGGISSAHGLIVSGGNVGIGTTAPNTLLHLERATAGALIRIKSNDVSLNNITIETEAVGSHYGLSFVDSGGYTILNLATNNRIGVGTNDPQIPFQINASGANAIQLGLNNRFGLGYDTGEQERYIIGSSYGNAATMMSFTLGGFTTASDKMTILGSGNVGIGETAPGSKLSVSGGGSFGASYDTTAAPTNGLIIEGNVGIGTTSPAQLLSVSGDSYLVGGLGVGNATTTDGIIETSGLAFVGGILKVKGTSTSTFAGGLSVGSGGLASSKGISLTGGVFNSSVTATSVFSGGLSISHLTTSDAITSNGAGTSTFTGGLSVGGGGLASSKGLVVSGGNTLITSGNVGVGTTAPTSRLHISSSTINPDGTTESAMRLTYGNSSNYFGNNQILLSYGGTANYTHAIKTRHHSEQAAANAIDFYTWNHGVDAVGAVGTKHVMTLDGTGNVGIGTTSPAQLLSVAGDSYLVGGLGVGNATTTDNNIELAGKLVAAGSINGAGTITLTGSGTSTYTGGLSVGGGGLASTKGISLTGGVFNSSVTATSVFSGGLSISHLTTSDAITSNGAGTSTFTGGLSVGGGGLASSKGLVVSGGNTLITSGNVGIGTTSPSALLTAHGNSSAFGALTTTWPIDNPSVDVKANSILTTLSNSSANTLIGQQINGIDQNGLNYTGIGQAITSVDALGMAIGQLIYSVANSHASAVGDSVGLLIDSVSSASASAASTAEGIRITNTITSTAANNAFAINSQSTAKSYFAGNVGIGTTAPGAKLEVNASADTQAIFKANTGFSGGVTIDSVDAGAAGGLRFAANGTNQWGVLYGLNVDDLDFYDYDNSLSRLHISNTGNVGIGTTSPGSIFQIAGVQPIIFLTDNTGATKNTQHFFLSSQEGGLYMGTSSNSNVSTATSTQFSFRNRDFAVHQGSICVDDDGTGCPATPTVGRLYAINATVLTDDLAEYMRSAQDLQPGDIVTVDPDFKNEGERTYEQERRSEGLGVGKSLDELGVKKTTEKFQKAIVGVVSTKPGITLGGYEPTDKDFEVALTGRVPVKVSIEAGPIEIGDYITSSSEPGVGMKADQSGNVVGIALETFDGTVTNKDSSISYVSSGTIEVFINLGYRKLDTAIVAGGVSEGMLIDQDTGAFMTADGTLDMNNNDIANIRSILSANGSWSIDENGNLKVATIEAQKVKTDKLEIGSLEKPTGITLYDEDTGEPYCLSIASGVTKTRSGACDKLSPEPTAPASSNNTDTDPPVIEILGNNPAEVTKGGAFVDPGVNVTDAVTDSFYVVVETKITDIQGNGVAEIDTSIAETYTITYTATDLAGNSSTAARTVIVGEPASSEPVGTTTPETSA